MGLDWRVWLSALRKSLSRLSNPGGWIETAVPPEGVGLTWSHQVDDLDLARLNLTQKTTLAYRQDNLGGYSYKPWVIKKLVPPISPADRRLRSEGKRFDVQLIAHGSPYKHCETPIEIWLAGAPLDYVPDHYKFALAKWHRYVDQMARRRYRVFATLVVASTSMDHEFSLLIPVVPPRLKPIPRVEALSVEKERSTPVSRGD